MERVETVQRIALADWLGALSEEDLARVLTLRPDALARPQPTSLMLLADRLCSDRSVQQAVAELDARVLLITEVLQALNRSRRRGVDRAAAEQLVGPRRAVLDEALEVLQQRALIWSDANTIYLADGLTGLWRSPLSLGAPLRRLLAGVATPQLLAAAKALGTSRQRLTIRAARELIAASLTDPEQVRLFAKAVSAASRPLLDELVRENPRMPLPVSAYGGPRLSEPADELLASGLVLPVPYSHAEMPLEVGLALRGEDYHPDIPDVLPQPETRPLNHESVRRQMAHAVPDAVQAVSDVAELCSRTPLAVLKTGGVGVREIRRAAKATGRPEEEVEFWLDLAAAAGLIAVGEAQVAPTPSYDDWRRLQPAERWLPIAEAWWALPHVPGHRMDEVAGRTTAVLATEAGDYGIARLRQDLLRTLAELPSDAAATGPDTVLQHLAFRRPMLYAFGEDPFAYGHATWVEAERLGLAALGALTPVGQAYVAGHPTVGAPDRTGGQALVDELRAIVPDAETVATFQADLTVVVTGPPSAGIADLLSSAADVESRGAAMSWRFSAGSVRRALDAGRTAEALIADLEAVAAHPLPQPLVYLIRDVGRRHGSVRATAVGCCLVADDAGLIAEILAAATRGRLASLELRGLAPTVLASAQPVGTTLAALRGAGYAPIEQGPDGALVIEVQQPTRTMPRPATARAPFMPRQQDRRRAQTAQEHLDATELARRLRAARGRGGRRGSPSPRPPGPADQGFDALAALRAEVGDPDVDRDFDPELDADLGPDRDRDVAPWVDTDIGIYADTGADADSEVGLRRAAPHLGDDEIRLLAYAIDTGEPVHIEYVDTRGSRTSRVVERLLLMGNAVTGWCRLRQDERLFLLRSVEAVTPA